MSIDARERRLIRQVLQLRYWQHRLNEDLKQRRFAIPVHLAMGHEAIAAAVDAAMQARDQLVLTHRNIAYNLARAQALEPVVAELLLLANGLSGGRLGSMNLANPARGVIYASSILGNNLSIACGLALAKQVRSEPGIVIALTGDGAMEEGAFYEGLVLAQSQRLPLLILIENNDYSMSSTIAQRRCPIAIERLCEAVGAPYQRLAGNDVLAYTASLEQTRALVEQRGAPACVEVALSTLTNHAGPTPGWPTDPQTIQLDQGLIVKPTADDPVFVARQRMGQAAYDALCDEILASGAVSVEAA